MSLSLLLEHRMEVLRLLEYLVLRRNIRSWRSLMVSQKEKFQVEYQDSDEDGESVHDHVCQGFHEFIHMRVSSYMQD